MTKRRSLNKTKIIESAFQLVEANGLESLSMRKLSELLGVKAMSLYNHIKNKEEIIDTLIDEVIGKMQCPDSNLPWREAMGIRCHSAHDVLLKHRWAAIPLLSNINKGPASFAYFESSLACLVGAGFTLAQADHAINALDSHVYGFTLIELNFPFKPEEYAKVAKEYIHMIPQETLPNMYALTKLVSERRYDGMQNFSFGLEIILDGLQVHLDGKTN
ncbi:MAG: TetR/AcrR family transcriptional regulator C-terminal domain-containing protein [Spirochaetota bacterium]